MDDDYVSFFEFGETLHAVVVAFSVALTLEQREVVARFLANCSQTPDRTPRAAKLLEFLAQQILRPGPDRTEH